MGPVWSRIGPEPNNVKEHVTTLHGTYAQLQTVKGTYTAIPATTIEPIINSTLHLLSKVAQHLEEQPNTGLATQIQEFFKEQLKEQRDAQIKEHEAIKTAIETATAPLKVSTQAGPRVASWAQVAAQAGPPPSHVTPPNTVLSPGNSSTLTAYKGREVVVKLLDHGLAQRFRQLSPTQLKNKVNSILQETPKLTDIKVAAAHQLKSGDVTVITKSLDDATKLQIYTEWARGLGPRAENIRTTYGAIVHGISVNTVNMKDQQGTIQRILADNYSVIPDGEITYVGWLTKESTKKRNSSMVIEFTRPEMANAIIYAGFLWEGLIHTCQLYDRSCRIKQCLRCYNYGHIGTQCSASQACGHCAGGHETRECTVKSTPGFVSKCTVCKGSHNAWNAACPARQKELQRVERAKQERNHYWPTPPRRTSSVTNSHDDQGPTPPLSSSVRAAEPLRQSQNTAYQPSQEPRILRSTRRRQQRNPILPPAETQTAQPQPITQTQPSDNLAPSAPLAVPDQANSGIDDPEFLDGDDWLQNLDLN